MGKPPSGEPPLLPLLPLLPTLPLLPLLPLLLAASCPPSGEALLLDELHAAPMATQIDAMTMKVRCCMWIVLRIGRHRSEIAKKRTCTKPVRAIGRELNSLTIDAGCLFSTDRHVFPAAYCDNR
jgi:hypothetical protein